MKDNAASNRDISCYFRVPYVGEVFADRRIGTNPSSRYLEVIPQRALGNIGSPDGLSVSAFGLSFDVCRPRKGGGFDMRSPALGRYYRWAVIVAPVLVIAAMAGVALKAGVAALPKSKRLPPLAG